MRTMRAKLRVTSVIKYPSLKDGKIECIALTFSAVCRDAGYNADGTGDEENNSYSRWTPYASLNMSIQNPALFDSFERDQEFYVDFTEATKFEPVYHPQSDHD